jgi:single-strand DNA-binding protein
MAQYRSPGADWPNGRESTFAKVRTCTIEGKNSDRSWEKEGIKRYTTEIYAEAIQMLGKKPDSVESHTATVAAAPEPDVQAPPHAADDLPF